LCAQKAHLRRAVVLATGKISSVQDDFCKQMCPRQVVEEMAIDRNEVNREASVAMVSTLERYREIFSTDLLPQKQLRHIDWLVSAKNVGDLRPQEPRYILCMTETPLQHSKHLSASMTSTTIT
jgi:hypothetical protein